MILWPHSIKVNRDGEIQTHINLYCTGSWFHPTYPQKNWFRNGVNLSSLYSAEACPEADKNLRWNKLLTGRGSIAWEQKKSSQLCSPHQRERIQAMVSDLTGPFWKGKRLARHRYLLWTEWIVRTVNFCASNRAHTQKDGCAPPCSTAVACWLL